MCMCKCKCVCWLCVSVCCVCVYVSMCLLVCPPVSVSVCVQGMLTRVWVHSACECGGRVSHWTWSPTANQQTTTALDYTHASVTARFVCGVANALTSWAEFPVLVLVFKTVSHSISQNAWELVMYPTLLWTEGNPLVLSLWWAITDAHQHA